VSYDLTLFRVPEGADAAQTYHELLARQERETGDLDSWLKRPVPEPVRAEMRRVADALKTWRPALEEFQPKSPLPWIELNDEDLAVQFCICERTVGVTMPYFGERAQEMMECAAGCFEILNSLGGFVEYDPQLGRIVTTADLGDMVAVYRRVDRELPGIVAGVRQSASAAAKPWWKVW
jgi:hypothetical protein